MGLLVALSSVYANAVRRNATARRRAVIRAGIDAAFLGIVAEVFGVEGDAFATVGREILAEFVTGAVRIRGRLAEGVHAGFHRGQERTLVVVSRRARVTACVRVAAALLACRARDATC